MQYDRINGQIYAIGRMYDYQLGVCRPSSVFTDSEIRKEKSRCINTFNYILAHKNQILFANLRFFINTGADNTVRGYYTAHFLKSNLEDPTNINKNQETDFREPSRFELEELNQELKTAYTKDDIITAEPSFRGRIVKIKNKSEMLAQSRLEKPLEVPVLITELRTHLDVGRAVEIIMFSPFLLVALPVVFLEGDVKLDNLY